MSERQLQRITEARASFLYVEHAFAEGVKGWKSICEVILNFRKTATEMIARVHNAEAFLTVALLGSNLNSILNYSPLFKDKREQSERIEEWILFCLINDFRDKTPWSPEETLSKVRRCQQLNATLMDELQQTGKNPFGDLTGAFLCDLLGDEVKKLCQEGTDCLDPFLLTLLADLFTITCSSSFSYWKTAYDKYEIVSGGLSTPSESDNSNPATAFFTDRLKGKPDGTYLYRDLDGTEREGWMPPDLLSSLGEGSGCQKLTHVLIREPSDQVHEDFWPLDNDTVTKFADTKGIVHVVSHLDAGEPKYNYISKRVWDRYDRILEIMMNPSMTDEQKKDDVKKIIEK